MDEQHGILAEPRLFGDAIGRKTPCTFFHYITVVGQEVQVSPHGQIVSAIQNLVRGLRRKNHMTGGFHLKDSPIRFGILVFRWTNEDVRCWFG